NEESGMYWPTVPSGKNEKVGWFWHQAPIEMQSLLIETFTEVKTQDAASQQKTIDALKTWLLKNKQTNNWKTTKATAEACYALLLQGTKMLDDMSTVEIKLGNSTFKSSDNKTEAGTGYFKKTIDGNMVEPEMGNISVTI